MAGASRDLLRGKELIGRDTERRGVGRALESHRVVTLTGPGGSGKTHLATAVARDLALAGAVAETWMVDLSAATTDAEVDAAFLTGVSVAPPSPGVDGSAPSQLESLGQSVKERAGLVLVDNCEHVLRRAADLVAAVVSAAPGLVVLATSREALGLAEERTWVLAPLDSSSTDSPGVLLFRERALAVDPGLPADDRTHAAMVDVCRQVDGMPLAIELAAARCRALSPQQIARYLEDDHRLLRVAGSTDRVAARQSSLEATIAWSYELLSDEEQQAFRLLCAPAGAFGLETAARMLRVDAVTAADLIDQLIARSLLTVNDLGDGLRVFRFLETIRSFGRARLDELGERDAARLRLELALLPPAECLGDHRWISTHYTAITGDRMGEGATRRAAARAAIESGRLEHAAFIAASSWAPDSAANVDVVHRLLTDVVAAADGGQSQISEMARFTVLAARATVECVAFRYFECLDTCQEGLDFVGDDHPGRGAFEAWQTVLGGGLDPLGVIETIDGVIDAQLPFADEAADFALGWLYLCKANALANVSRLAEARDAAIDARRWLSPTVSEQPVTHATILWLDHLQGRPQNVEVAASAERYASSDVGFEMCAKAALAVTGPGTVEQRARRLVDVARHRPLGRWHREESELLVGFAHLALEEGRVDDARRLAEATYFRNPPTIIALVHMLARLDEWSEEEWGSNLAALAASRFSPGPDAPDSAVVLAGALERWDRRIDASEPPHTGVAGAVEAAGADEHVRLEVLGPVRAMVGADHHAITAAQQRSILVGMALSHPEPVSVSALVDAVWGEDPPASARRALQAQISRLRALLPDVVIEGDSRSGLRLALPVEAVDASEFRVALVASRSVGGESRVAGLARALALWRGDLDSDIPGTAIQAAIASLQASRETAEDELVAVLVEVGDVAAAIELGERLVVEQPLRERRWVLLIDALVAADRRGDALRAFQRGRDVLVAELGIEPGDEMRAAEQRALT